MVEGGREGGGGLITEWDTDAKQAIYNNKLCLFEYGLGMTIVMFAGVLWKPSIQIWRA